MKRNLIWILGLVCIGLVGPASTDDGSDFRSAWPETATRFWIGPEYWSNRLQDWQLKEGRLECIGAHMPLRTVHLLTRSLTAVRGELHLSIRTGVISADAQLSGEAWRGFLIGAGSENLDYRARALIHHGTGKNGGLAAVLNGRGELVFHDNEEALNRLPVALREGSTLEDAENRDIELRLAMQPEADTYTITIAAHDPGSGTLRQKAILKGVEAARLAGNLAIISHGGAGENRASFWFRDWRISGSKVAANEERRFGPILSVMHTLSNGVMKMTVQMPPVAQTDPQRVGLELAEKGTHVWRSIAEASMVVPGWTVHFRIPEWDAGKDFDYRLIYPGGGGGKAEAGVYAGVIPRDPMDNDEIVVAAFTGNSNTHGTFGKAFDFAENRIWFPHADIMSSVKTFAPDLLVFTGDQVYESRPTAADRSGEFSSYLDYLYKWYLWSWAYGELSRNIPTVCLLDDHDVYHGNIWGAGGRKTEDLPKDGKYPEYYKGQESYWRQDTGGYFMPADFVKMTERIQAGHLPDPYDPTPIEQGIGVYYTSLNYGGISFAILEDRKFKSSPSVVLPEAQVINGFSQAPDFDAVKADVPGAVLLGERQQRFLRDWVSDWKGAWMKVALSQTVFANVTTYPVEFKIDTQTPQLKPLPADVIPGGYDYARDMDSNGWPQTGRNRAIDALRRGFAFHISGDQHLGSIVHYGIDEWNDSGFSFCVPSIANLWPRRWYPPAPGNNRKPELPAYTGEYKDGFGNRITVWGVANPVISNREPPDLHDRAPGFGIVRLRKREQTITMECWPRYEDPRDSNAKQYPGWPMTVSLEDNYGREAAAWLPTLKFSGMEYPVVQLLDEADGEIVYTIRARGDSFRAKVFKPGLYTVRVGEPGTDRMKTLKGVRSLPPGEAKTLTVEF